MSMFNHEYEIVVLSRVPKTNIAIYVSGIPLGRWRIPHVSVTACDDGTVGNHGFYHIFV
jgi:hypothetical protein